MKKRNMGNPKYIWDKAKGQRQLEASIKAETDVPPRPPLALPWPIALLIGLNARQAADILVNRGFVMDGTKSGRGIEVNGSTVRELEPDRPKFPSRNVIQPGRS